MFWTAYLPILLWPVPVQAVGWDDFSDNLATDLAPFLSLFGDQITKQYLSESITHLDYLIFALAPMGILTAIVSAIRVCGSPSLRAFVGRAQEGSGNAEAELCSSTSRDLCELYNNGGIARVFGRPKILEVVVQHPKAGDGGGIYTFQEYHSRSSEWKECKSGPRDSEGATEPFAPNLSLNVGIKRQPRAVFVAVAITGLALQVGVLIFAAVVTYQFKWDKEGKPIDTYACPLIITGTMLVCVGIYLCAFLVGGSTGERIYRRKHQQHAESTIYWIQPGGQVLGDQTFDAFCWNDSGEPLQEYITSWKATPRKSRKRAQEIKLWLTVCVTISGFVLQFIGLRGLHSAIAVTQLGAIMVMSALRAALRMQRLSPSDNYLAKRLDEVTGHELDWLALKIGAEGSRRSGNAEGPKLLWRFTGVPDTTEKRIDEVPPKENPSAAYRVLAYRSRLAQLTRSIARESGTASGARNFEVEMVEGRREAGRLQSAMEATLTSIFSKAKVRPKWKAAEVLYWNFTCAVSNPAATSKDKSKGWDHCTMALKFERSPEMSWKLHNATDLEALFGLWVWSLKCEPMVEFEEPHNGLIQSRAAEVSSRRIISVDHRTVGADLALWLPGSMASINEGDIRLRSSADSGPGTIWTGQPYNLLARTLPKNVPPGTARLFGWHAVEASKITLHNTHKVWSTPAQETLLSLCAQEVFASFVKSVLDVTDDIGGIGIVEKPQLRLDNPLVAEVSEIFTENELGHSDEALLYIVPLVLPRLKLPLSGAVLATAKSCANQHRRHREWTEAEAVLKWAWMVCMSSRPGDGARNTMESAAIALGELYRWALRDSPVDPFASTGVEWLFVQASSQSGPDHTALTAIAQRYREIEKEVSKVNYSGAGILQSINWDDLTATLIYLTRHSPSLSYQEINKALCLAAQRAWPEVICALIDLGADVNHQDSNFLTALSHACIKGDGEIVSALMNAGASSSLADNKEKFPLSYASEMGHLCVVEILLDNPHTFLNPRDKDGRTPLFWAAKNGHLAVVQYLLQKGVVVDEQDGFGQTPLSCAACYGHKAVVRHLLDKGAAVSTRDNEERTPLIYAAQGGHLTIVQLLLKKGAMVDEEGMTNERRFSGLLKATMSR